MSVLRERSIHPGEETMRFWVPGPLPGLNEIVEACKGCGGRGLGYASMKKRWTNHVAIHAMAGRVPRLDRIRLECLWVEPEHANRARRDRDNIEGGGLKFLLDGLKMSKKIPDDNPDCYLGAKHDHEYGAKPGVWVTVVPA